jgi:hypothetical protein
MHSKTAPNSGKDEMVQSFRDAGKKTSKNNRPPGKQEA